MRHMKTSDQTQAILFGKIFFLRIFEIGQNQTGLDQKLSSILKFLESGFSVRKIKFDSLKLN